MDESMPDARPVGYLALGVAVLGLFLSVSYFFSLLAYLVVLVSFPLGFLALTEPRARRAGTLSIVVSVLAVVAATATLMIVG